MHASRRCRRNSRDCSYVMEIDPHGGRLRQKIGRILVLAVDGWYGVTLLRRQPKHGIAEVGTTYRRVSGWGLAPQLHPRSLIW